jgi:hypothetical protein
MIEDKIKELRNELDKKIEELMRQKEELMLEEGKAYRCKKCSKIAMRSLPTQHSSFDEDEKEGLCYDCWSKKVQGRRREKLIQTFKDAKIIDIVPGNNPFGSINEVERIVLKVNEKHYEVVLVGYDECYMEIREEHDE